MDKTPDKLFVIAAGGTGAKVAESLIHLCAAGLGPEEIHVLLVDGDVTNGNRERTEKTAACYSQIRDWPWTIESPRDRKRVTLFTSKLYFYVLAERFDKINDEGLLPQIRGDAELVQAIRVLLDDDEMVRGLSHGFTGCPNLGSLVMDRYLRRYFAPPPPSPQNPPKVDVRPTAHHFIEKLVESTKPADSSPKVVIVGSIFGGTGASLIPVARRCVEDHFNNGNANGQPITALFQKIQWGKVLLLPYFKPRPGAGMQQVNPDRHLMDTSSALWYYGLHALQSGANEGPCYMIGSEAPEDREAAGFDGGQQQTNPPFYHEILGALAILDFYGNPDIINGRPVRHFSNRGRERCDLTRLPCPAGLDRKVFLDQLGLLLQLGAFSLLAHDTTSEYARGLFHYTQSARLTGWETPLHHRFLTEAIRPNDTASPANKILQYFGRLLLWVKHTLPTSVIFDPDLNYIGLQNTLCSVEKTEVCVSQGGRPFFDPADNLVARLCRTVAAALLREEANDRGHQFEVTMTRLVEDSKLVRVGLPDNWVPTSLRYFQVMSDDELIALCRSYSVNPPDDLKKA